MSDKNNSEKNQKRQLRWMRLDNAAKIYPASKKRNWSNVFRLSVTLGEEVDPEILQSAVDVTVKRFPSIAVRLRRGMFWYYLEEIGTTLEIRKEHSYPLTHMPFDDILKCAVRVLYYRNRIAVEFFHAVADGNSGLIFLKSLTAEYPEQKHGISIPFEQGVFNRREQPAEEEFSDDFIKYSGRVSAKRAEATAYQLKGRLESGGYKNLIIASLDVKSVLEKARSYGVSLTEFIVAVMIASFMDLQDERVPKKRQKPVKVLAPVNLRRLFPSRSLRNFVLYVTPGIDPKMGEYTFEEIVHEVHNQMTLEITPQRMASRIRANVKMEQMFILKILPLFIKNIGMKIVYDLTGEKKSCITVSNLGAVRVPPEMEKYIERFGFTLGVQLTSPNNCSVISYGDKLYIGLIRSIEEPVLEQKFIGRLKALGLHVRLESNQRRQGENEECTV